MDKGCPNEFCYYPETPCHLSHADVAVCPSWKASPHEQDEEATKVALTDEILLPWTGGALGSVDMPFLAARARPRVIGVFGPYNAGKTTLLAALYSMVAAGRKHPDALLFAGSYTLTGWEAIAQGLKWQGPSPPTFPAHTAMDTRRGVGLLHLAFRKSDGGIEDILFADAPGEWFYRWAHEPLAADAAGAAWLISRAEAFMLIADSEALAGDDRGNARNVLKVLGQRLGAERTDRPVALVWSKSDVQVAPGMRESIRNAAAATIPNLTELSVSVVDGETPGSAPGRFMALLAWATQARRPALLGSRPVADTGDPFLAYAR